MQQSSKIEICIDPSLLDHFTENLGRHNSNTTPETAIVELITSILDDSAFPIEARRSGKNQIQVAYHLRSFSQPIFD